MLCIASRLGTHAARTLAAIVCVIGCDLLSAEQSPLAANCKAIVHYPWPPATQPVLEEARKLVKSGDAEAALRVLDEHSSDSNEIDFLATRALTLKVLGRHEDALAEIDRVLSRDPEYANGKVYRVAILVELGRSREAFVYINEALGKATDAEQEARLMEIRVQLHLDKGDFTAAIIDSSELIKDDPTALHYFQRAFACLQAGLYEAAIVDCKETLAREPRHTDVKLLLAMIYSTQDKPALVCEVLTEACKADKQHLSAARGLAQYVHKTESIADYLTADEMRQAADHYFDLASECSPDVVEHGHYMKGQIYLKTGDLEVAEKHLLIAQSMIDEAEPQAKIRLALESLRQRKDGRL